MRRLRFLFICFLSVQRCSIGGLFRLWFFDGKNRLCRYGIGLQTNSLFSHWFYETIGFKNADYRRKSRITSHCVSKFFFDFVLYSKLDPIASFWPKLIESPLILRTELR